MQILQQIQDVYVGDSIIEQVLLDLKARQCIFVLDRAMLLKKNKPDIFDPERRFAPAYLSFEGIHSIGCLEGNFYLNSTIVGFEAVMANDLHLVEFQLQVTGGFSDETFVRTIVIVSQSFNLKSAV